jgi:hypothetical protein
MRSLLLIMIGLFFSVPLFAEEKNSIGYSSVADALEALKKLPDAEVSVQGGWTIINTKEGKNFVLWSFTPATHAAHPTAVKRIVLEEGGMVKIDTRALCQAKKAACDKLMAEFDELNKKISQNYK